MLSDHGVISQGPGFSEKQWLKREEERIKGEAAVPAAEVEKPPWMVAAGLDCSSGV